MGKTKWELNSEMNSTEMQSALVNLTWPELRVLNEAVVMAMRSLRDRQARKLSLLWEVGDKAAWTHKGRLCTGVVTRVNLKTLSIKGDDGFSWRVGYSSASKAEKEE